MAVSYETREDYESYLRSVEKECLYDFYRNCRIHSLIRVRSFVSTSKGKGRKRPTTEVRLISYRGSRFMLWHKFPFDKYATEVMGDIPDAEARFINAVENLERIGYIPTGRPRGRPKKQC